MRTASFPKSLLMLLPVNLRLLELLFQLGILEKNCICFALALPGSVFAIDFNC